jgi:hypothetical protein
MLILYNTLRNVFFLCLFTYASSSVYSDSGSSFVDKQELIDKSIAKFCKKQKKLSYYLYIDDFVNSFIEIPTANISGSSTTISSIRWLLNALLWHPLRLALILFTEKRSI